MHFADTSTFLTHVSMKSWGFEGEVKIGPRLKCAGFRKRNQNGFLKGRLVYPSIRYLYRHEFSVVSFSFSI